MTKYVNDNGVSEMWANTKNYISAQLLGKSDVGHTHSASDITSGLATVATSGSYNDLSNKPTIPSKTSDLTNDSGFITEDNTKIPLAGSNQISGDLIPATDNAYNLGDSTYGFASFYVNKLYLKGSTIFKLVDDSFICLGGATAQANGANLVLNGKNRSTSTGEFKLEARDGTNVKQLIGKPDGTLSWNGDIIPSTDDTCNLGSSSYSFQYVNTRIIRQNNLSDSLFLIGAPNWNEGASLSLFGKNNTTLGGGFRLDAHNETDFKRLQGSADGILTWNGTYIYPSINNTCYLGIANKRWKEIWCIESSLNSSSDERQKQQIKPIDNDLLDAWENVNPIEFKWNDAVAEKGNNARVHTGYIAQNIQQALTENGVNPNDYGLFLYDEWGEEQEEKDEQGNIVRPYRPSGNAYGLRYTEALIVECAYLRKCIKELRNEIEQLKSSK